MIEYEVSAILGDKRKFIIARFNEKKGDKENALLNNSIKGAIEQVYRNKGIVKYSYGIITNVHPVNQISEFQIEEIEEEKE